jgi:hypothetical protein
MRLFDSALKRDEGENRLSLGRRIVFHSFRITFRDEISQTFVKDELLNAITGHEDGDDDEKMPDHKIPGRLVDAATGTSSERGTGALYERPLLYRIETLQKVVEAFSPPLKLDFLAPIAGAIRSAPSDKHLWAENLPPRQRATAVKKKGVPATKKAATIRRRPVRKA